MVQHISELRNLSPDVVAAAVVDLDGALEEAVGAEAMEGVMGPASTTLSTIAERAAQELGRGALDTTILEGAYGHVIIRDVGDGRKLVVVAEPSARLGLLLDDVKACARRIGGLHA